MQIIFKPGIFSHFTWKNYPGVFVQVSKSPLKPEVRGHVPIQCRSPESRQRLFLLNHRQRCSTHRNFDRSHFFLYFATTWNNLGASVDVFSLKTRRALAQHFWNGGTGKCTGALWSISRISGRGFEPAIFNSSKMKLSAQAPKATYNQLTHIVLRK